MAKLIKIEKAFFYFLSFAFFWQWRFIWTPAGRQFNEWISFYLYATDLIILAVLFLWLARELREKQRNSNPPQPSLEGGNKNGFPLLELAPHLMRGGVRGDFIVYKNIVLCFFLLFCALSLFVARDKELGFYRLVKLLEFVGLYFYVRYNFIKLFNWRRFWRFFIAGATLQSIVAIWQFLAQKSLGLKFFAESPLAPDIDGVAKIVVDGAKIVRAYGLVPHPNILAAILIAAIFGLVWLRLERKNYRHSECSEESFTSTSVLSAYVGDPSGETLGMTRGRIGILLFIIIFVLLSVALLFTFSRSIIVIGYAALILWLIFTRLKNKKYRKLIQVVLALMFIVNCLLSIVWWPYFSSRFDLQSIGDSQSLNLRVFYNQAALDFIKTSPLLGVGLGNFVPTLASEYDQLQSWVWQPVHNIYLLILAETGLLGLLAFLAFLFLTIKNAFHGEKLKNPLVSCFLFLVFCFLIVGFFDHFLWDLQQGQILFWLMLGLLSARSSMDPL